MDYESVRITFPEAKAIVPKKKARPTSITVKALARQEKLLEIIKDKMMLVKDVVDIAGYNARTVRRDLTAMIKRGEAINHAIDKQAILVRAA